jgi:hypothetical protein
MSARELQVILMAPHYGHELAASWLRANAD